MFNSRVEVERRLHKKPQAGNLGKPAGPHQPQTEKSHDLDRAPFEAPHQDLLALLLFLFFSHETIDMLTIKNMKRRSKDRGNKEQIMLIGTSTGIKTCWLLQGWKQ